MCGPRTRVPRGSGSGVGLHLLITINMMSTTSVQIVPICIVCNSVNVIPFTGEMYMCTCCSIFSTNPICIQDDLEILSNQSARLPVPVITTTIADPNVWFDDLKVKVNLEFIVPYQFIGVSLIGFVNTLKHGYENCIRSLPSEYMDYEYEIRIEQTFGNRSSVYCTVTLPPTWNHSVEFPKDLIDERFCDHIGFAYHLHLGQVQIPFYSDWLRREPDAPLMNQGGKDRRKDKRRTDNSRPIVISDLEDYKPIRRGLLSLEKTVTKIVDWEALPPDKKRLFFTKVANIVAKMKSPHEHIDMHCDLKMHNQTGLMTIDIDSPRSCYDDCSTASSSSTIDDVESLFGRTGAFMSTFNTLISVHLPGLSPGEKYKLAIQVSLWSYEILTADSLYSAIRKIILLGTYIFPDNCSRALESIAGIFINQSALQCGADWISVANSTWKQNGSMIGRFKKVCLLTAAGIVFRSKIAEMSLTELMSSMELPYDELEKKSIPDLLGYFLECTEWFVQNLADFTVTWKVYDLFKSRDIAERLNLEFTDCQDEFNRLKVFGKLLMAEADLTKLRERCFELRNELKKNLSNPKLGGVIAVKTMLFNVNIWLATLDAKFLNAPLRKTPFGIMCYGLPDTAKSSVSTRLWQSIAAANDWSTLSSNTCNINSDDKFQSTADHQQRVHIDDINQALASTKNGVNEAMLILRIVNPIPFPVNKAEVMEKGNHTLSPEVLTVTSQTRHMYAHECVQEPAAIERRFKLFVHCEIKPEYAGPGGSLDRSKTRGIINCDPYLLTLTSPEATGVTASGKQVIAHNYVVYDFEDGNGPVAAYKISLAQASLIATSLQKQHAEDEECSLKRIQQVNICEHKRLADLCLQCPQNQSFRPTVSDEITTLRKSLIGQCMSYTTANPKVSIKDDAASPAIPMMVMNDDAAHLANIADIESEDAIESEVESLDNQSTLLYLPLLYTLATINAKLPIQLPVITSYFPELFAPLNYILNHEAVLSTLGIYGVLLLKSFCNVFIVCSVFMFIFPIFSCILVSFLLTLLYLPTIGYDEYMKHAISWTMKQHVSYAMQMSRLRWARANKGSVLIVSLAFVTGIAALTRVWYSSRETLVNEAGANSSEVSSLKPDEWKVKSIVITPYLMNTKNHTAEQVLGTTETPGMISERTAYCIADGGFVCNATPLCGNYWVFPYHFLQLHHAKLVTMYILSDTSNGGKFLWRPGTEKITWQQIPGHDLAIAHVSSLPPQKDLRSLLHPDPKSCRIGKVARIIYKHRNSENHIVVDDMPIILDKMKITISSDDPSLKYEAQFYDFFNCESAGGMCGSPIIPDGKFPCILGFHTQGKGPRGCCDVVSLKEIDSVLEQLVQKPVNTFNIHSDDVDIKGGVSYVAHDKHLAQYIPDTTNVMCLGIANNLSKRKVKMNTTQTPIYEDVINECGINDIWHPAPCKPEWLAKHDFIKSVSEPPLLRDDIVMKCHDDYMYRIENFFRDNPEKKHEIFVLSDEENAKGVPGVIGLEGINLKTSKGTVGLVSGKYSNFGPKTDILKPRYIDDEGLPAFEVDIDENFLDEIKEIEAKCIRGERLHFVNSTNEKDETVKQTKLHARIFNAMPLHAIWLQRKYFLTIMTFFRNYNFITECGVGVNSRSKMWEAFGDYLRTPHPDQPPGPDFSEDESNNIAGDFTKFDRKAPVMLLTCIFHIFIRIAIICGFSEDDIKIMQVLATEGLFPIYELNSDLIGLTGTVPSGASWTVILNSILNSLWLRYVFYILFKVPPARFHEVIRLLTYGDDNVGRVAKIARAFNQQSIARVLAEVGVTYTDAHKRSVFPEFEKFSDISFLKRTFTYFEDLGHVVGPIEKGSVYKSLLYHIPTKADGETVQTQMASTISCALDELFFHGRDEFDSFKEKIFNIARKNELLVHFNDRCNLSYDERIVNWKETYGIEEISLGMFDQ